SQIPQKGKRIKRVFLEPNPVFPLPEAVNAVLDADLVVISPGSLYTSILPNLIVPQIVDALKTTKAKVVYVCNVMTQAGETSNYTASDHVRAIIDHVGEDCLQTVVVHNKTIDPELKLVYAEENAEPVRYDIDRLKQMNVEV